MKAVVQVGYGSADVLEFKEIDKPAAVPTSALAALQALRDHEVVSLSASPVAIGAPTQRLPQQGDGE